MLSVAMSPQIWKEESTWNDPIQKYSMLAASIRQHCVLMMAASGGLYFSPT